MSIRPATVVADIEELLPTPESAWSRELALVPAGGARRRPPGPHDVRTVVRRLARLVVAREADPAEPPS
jgi:hypothetical protein